MCVMYLGMKDVVCVMYLGMKDVVCVMYLSSFFALIFEMLCFSKEAYACKCLLKTKHTQAVCVRALVKLEPHMFEDVRGIWMCEILVNIGVFLCSLTASYQLHARILLNILFLNAK